MAIIDIMYEPKGLPVDLFEALRLISVTIRRETWVVNCSRSENFSVMVLGGAFPKTCNSQKSTLKAADTIKTTRMKPQNIDLFLILVCFKYIQVRK